MLTACSRDLRDIKMLCQTPVTDLLIEELIQVQTHHLSLLGGAQVHARNVLQDQEQNARDGERVRADRSDLSELLADLNAIAIDAARILRTAIKGGHP